MRGFRDADCADKRRKKGMIQCRFVEPGATDPLVVFVFVRLIRGKFLPLWSIFLDSISRLFAFHFLDRSAFICVICVRDKIL